MVAQAAVSPPEAGTPAGTVWPLPGPASAAAFDAATASLVVVSPGSGGTSAVQSAVTILSATGAARSVALPSAATALSCAGGQAYLSTRGGYLRVAVATGAVTHVDVDGQRTTDFTAIGRRSDGKLVLGSADGAVYTLASDTAVGARLDTADRVDALVTQGDTTVVLDRGRSSVTTIDATGTKARQSLRAGDGATTMVLDTAGRVLVADTRGAALLVFGADPLILRQRYPVPDAPYGLAGSASLAWVSQTATNMVVGYDLSTGIPVEKVRYRTVRQPNLLAFDTASGTLYVVSGSGAGVQVIAGAAGRRR